MVRRSLGRRLEHGVTRKGGFHLSDNKEMKGSTMDERQSRSHINGKAS